MRIIGVDPGIQVTGWGIIEGNSKKFHHIDNGAIFTQRISEFAKRLKIIYDGINNVIKKYSPDTAVVENIFFAHDIKTALKLGHSRGIVLLSLANAGVFIYEYAPLEVKQAIVGYGMASKDQVQKMVLKLLKLNPNDLRFNKYDISDALALAICHIQTNLELKTDDRQQTIVQSSRFNVQS